jgi:hypothetical protein
MNSHIHLLREHALKNRMCNVLDLYCGHSNRDETRLLHPGGVSGADRVENR